MVLIAEEIIEGKVERRYPDYQPTGLSETIFKERYSRDGKETWLEACRRVAKHVSSVEIPYIRKGVQPEFERVLRANLFMPGGRIWYGAGRTRSQLLNCFVVPTADSREGWGKTISDIIVISGMGGGVGVNLSPIRPRGSPIKGTGGITTGSVSLMDIINSVGEVIQDGGGRRMALMLDLDITHPDLLEFIEAKLDKKRLTNANVSVVLSMPTEEFVTKVREKQDLELVWDGEVKGHVNAAELWAKIVQNAWNSGEPGVLNSYLANKENNIWYHKDLVSTNPCGEIWLEEYGCCCLGALVLPRFVNDGVVDWDTLQDTITTSVRFLDDVLLVNEYPLPEIRENCLDVNRIGLGVMGLHTMLIKMGLRYSSDEAFSFVDKLMDFIKISAYEASIDLAREKGPFRKFDTKMLDSGFVQRALPPHIRQDILKYGIRNCAILTIAPTGTTGMVSDVSTGIEPIFAPAYWRRYHKVQENGSRKLEKELVVDQTWLTLESEGGDTSILEGAYDVPPTAHFEMQRICQSHIDNATSKTINLPADFPIDELAELWLDYLPHVKGTTFYRAGSRGEEPLEAIPVDQVAGLVHERNTVASILKRKVGIAIEPIHVANIEEQSVMDCPDGVCDIRHRPENYEVVVASP